jgi:hypothetical protein
MDYSKDNNDLVGLPTLDPKVAAFKKFVQENKNSPDLMGYLGSPEGKRLAAENPRLVGAMLALEKLEAASKGSQARMPTSTVVDDLTGGIESLVGQQQQPAQAGISALPNPVMNQAQFAGGGIVAFQDGGWLEGFGRAIAAGSQAAPVNPVARQITEANTSIEVLARSYEDALSKNDPARTETLGAALRRTPQGRKVLSDIEQRKRVQDMQAQSAASRDSMQQVLSGETAPPTTPDQTSALAPAPAPTPAPAPAAPPPVMGVSASNIDRLFADTLGEKPDRAKLTTEREAEQRALGTGRFSVAAEDEKKFIKEQQEKLGKRPEEAKKDFWVMLGASLLGNRSQYFQVALGEGIKENYGNLMKDLKEISKEEKDLQVLGLQLRRAQEQAMESDRKEDITRYDALQTKYENKQLVVAQAILNAQEKVIDRQVQLKIAELRETGDVKLSQQLLAEFEAAKDPKLSPEERKARLDALNEKVAQLAKITAATSGAVIAAQQKGAMIPGMMGEFDKWKLLNVRDQ